MKKLTVLLSIVVLCLSSHSSLALSLSPSLRSSLREFAAGRKPTPIPKDMKEATFVKEAQLLQNKVQETPMAIYCAFALAHRNVNYSSNIKGLVKTVEKRKGVNLFYGNAYADDDLSVGDVADLLKRLYLHRPDSNLLKYLLTWKFDGAPQETLIDIRYELLLKYPRPVMDMASSLPNGLMVLSETLDFYYPDMEYRNMKKKVENYVSRNSGSKAAFGRKLLKTVGHNNNKMEVR